MSRTARSRPSHAPPAPVALALIATGVVVAIGLNGAWHPGVRAVVHGLIGAALVVLALRPPQVLAGGGRAVRLALAGLPVLVADVLVLIPLPPEALALVAPMTHGAWGAAWHPATLDTPDTVARLLDHVLLLGGMVALATALRPHKRGVPVETMASGGLLGLACIAVLHRLLGLDALYGVWPVATEAAPWAPLVNGNFVAMLAIGLLPASLGGLAHRPAVERPATWLHGLAVLAGLGLVVWVGALGALAAGTAAGLYALARWAAPSRWVLAPVAAAVTAVLGGGTLFAAARLQALPQPESLEGRWTQWSRSLVLLGDQPLVGSGPGTYAAAYPPYQPMVPFHRFDHAHNDPLQFLVESGALGAIALVLALLLLPRPRVRPLSHRAAWVEVGLVAWLVHACVDFPLQLPGLALVVGLALTVRLVAWEHPRSTSGTGLRAVLIGLAALQGLGALGQAHRAWVDASAPALLQGQADPDALARVQTLAPWRPEPPLAEARAAARRGEAEAARVLAERAVARAPYDPDVLLQAGAVATHLRDLDTARARLDRAMTRHAADHRSRALASRVAQAAGDDAAALTLWAEALRRWPYTLAVEQRPVDRALDLQPEGLWWIAELEDLPRGYPLVLLGHGLRRRGDPATAWVAYQRAEDIDPRAAHIPAKGLALVEMGDVESGLAWLAEVDAHDDDGTARRLRAGVLLDLGRPDEAREDALAALREDRANPAHVTLAVRATAEARGASAAAEQLELLDGPPGLADPARALIVAAAAAEEQAWSECIRWTDPLAGQAAADRMRARCLTACPLCRTNR